MVTVKRLYLYGVLSVALVPLLLGCSHLLQLALEGFADVVGVRALGGSRLAREELSWALALVVVAAPIWVLHAWLLRLSVRRSESDAIDERASAARATYFFVVLAIALGVAGWCLFELTSAVIRFLASGDEAWSLAGPVAGAAVAGTAWALHLRWRARDLGVAPQRTAGDWLTRLYLYGVLFVAAAVALMLTANLLTTVARQLLELRPAWESAGWWKEAIVAPLAGILVASMGWLIHWSLCTRLLALAPPMGEAHRQSRTRTGYLLGVVLLCAGAVLVLASTSLRHIIAAPLGVWQPSDGSRLIEDVGGPMVMLAPFLAAWWWHIRRSSAEALAFGGPLRARSVTRSGRYVVALVGFAGLSIGLAWELQAILDIADASARRGVISAAVLRDSGTPALATALVGLLLWTPAWLLSLRDRARDPLEVAGATSRRAYLLLVSGLSVVALMGSLAYLVYQVMGVLLETGQLDDTSWAISILVVASVVLAYHLLMLRSDLRLAATAETPRPGVAEEGGMETVGAVEMLELRGPAGADFEALNAAIRSRLPEGYTLRLVAGAERLG
jgi:hypothetical protein